MRKYHCHRQNNKGIVRVCPLRNAAVCFRMGISPGLGGERLNDFVIVYVPFPEKSDGQFLSRIVVWLFGVIVR